MGIPQFQTIQESLCQFLIGMVLKLASFAAAVAVISCQFLIGMVLKLLTF